MLDSAEYGAPRQAVCATSQIKPLLAVEATGFCPQSPIRPSQRHSADKRRALEIDPRNVRALVTLAFTPRRAGTYQAEIQMGRNAPEPTVATIEQYPAK